MNRKDGQVGNRMTENKKRTEAAWMAARHCPDCIRTEVPTIGPGGIPGYAPMILCDVHRCTGVTRQKTRCRNSATYPEERSCAVHLTQADTRQSPLSPAASEPLQLTGEAVAHTEATALYRWYDESDRLLYLGISDNLPGRVKGHVRGSSWMDFAVRSTVARFPTRKEAAEAETAAIKAEQPLFNDVHNRTPEAKARLVEFLIEHGRADLLAPSVSRG